MYVCMYDTGSLGVVWFVLWVLLAHSSPASHPRISPAERKYIESSLEEEGNAVKVGLAVVVHYFYLLCKSGGVVGNDITKPREVSS